MDNGASGLVLLLSYFYIAKSTSYVLRVLLVHINDDGITKVLSQEVTVIEISNMVKLSPHLPAFILFSVHIGHGWHGELVHHVAKF